VADGRQLVATPSRSGPFSGMEIWSGSMLVYSDTSYGDAKAAPIDSPVDTPDTTMLPI